MPKRTPIVFLFTIGYLAMVSSTLAASPVYVDAAYSKESANSHIYGTDAFKTIQEGINAVDKGGIVYVQKGLYNEALTIEKPLSLIGLGKQNKIGATNAAAIVDGGQANGTIIINGASGIINVTIRNLSINHGIHGVAVLQNANVTIANNSIQGYSKNGVTFGPTLLPGEGGVKGSITNNIITGKGPTDFSTQNGIQIAENNTATISDNLISGNIYTVPGKKWATGILVHRSKGVTISNNSLTFNQAGVNILQASSNTITGNTILGNTLTRAGIMVSDSDGPLFIATKNVISRNNISGGFIGIWTSYATANKYLNNKISNMEQYGIYTWDSDANTILGNTITGIHSPSKDGNGIRLDGGDTAGTIGSTQNYVSTNTVSDSDFGFFAEDNSQNNTLIYNRF